MSEPITLDDPTAYFERLADFEADHWWSTALWRIAARWIDAEGGAGRVAIDVGCGAGMTLARLAARPGIASVIGVDPIGAALIRARSHGHQVASASALALPFPSEAFELATCLDVFQHLPPEGDRVAAGEIARVLRPGGIAILRTNCGGKSAYRLGDLRATLEPGGLRVERATRVNFVGSMAQVVRGRLRPGRVRSHPEGGGLPGPATGGKIGSRVMAAVGRAEAFIVAGLGWDLPYGHSAMVLARKVRGG